MLVIIKCESKQTEEYLINRRAELKKQLAEGLILLKSNEVLKFIDDDENIIKIGVEECK